MTLELELTPEEEARLSRAAEAHGLPLPEYARVLLGLEAPTAERLSPDEWDSELDKLCSDVDPSVPPLSDEALSRRRIYGEA